MLSNSRRWARLINLKEKKEKVVLHFIRLFSASVDLICRKNFPVSKAVSSYVYLCFFFCYDILVESKKKGLEELNLYIGFSLVCILLIIYAFWLNMLIKVKILLYYILNYQVIIMFSMYMPNTPFDLSCVRVSTN